MIEPYIDHLVANKVTKVFRKSLVYLCYKPFVFFTFFSVNGSAAEHSLLSVEERKKLAEKFLAAGKGKLDLIVIQCGTENLVNTKELVCYVVPIMNCIIKILHFRLLMLKVLVLIVWQPLHQLISRLKIQVGTVYLINGGIIQYTIFLTH